MNKITLNRSSDLYYMILGGLIALSSEQNVGKLSSKTSSENTFLGKWLKRAKKQRRYPKSVSTDIDNFLDVYFKQGHTGDLSLLFKNTFCEFQTLKRVPKIKEETDKQRFDYAMKSLIKAGWHVSLPIDHSKDSDAPYRPIKSKEIFTTKWYWQGAFNEESKLVKPFSIFVVSDPQMVIDCFYEHGFILVVGLSSHDNEGNDYYQYQIFPKNNCYGKLAIPNKFQL